MNMYYDDEDLDSDNSGEEVDNHDLGISKEMSEYLYDKAGDLVEEDAEEISLTQHQHLLNDSVAQIISEVLYENPLPFKLQDFQLLTLHCIGSLRNVVLISPTGRSFKHYGKKLLCTPELGLNATKYESQNSPQVLKHGRISCNLRLNVLIKLFPCIFFWYGVCECLFRLFQ